MEAVYRVLRYLKGVPGKGTTVKKNYTKDIKAYSDVDWAGSPIIDILHLVTVPLCGKI